MRRITYLSILMMFACGTAGNNLSKGSKCINGGAECHDESNPTPDPPDPSSYTGPRGDQGVPGKDGKDSIVPGPAGPNGVPGSSCSVSRTIGGSLIQCTDGTSAVVLDGINGADGRDGVDAPPTPYTVTSIYDPCGKQTTYDEVLLRLANGQLLAHYASGSLQYLTVIGPGNYVTTDNSSCYFTVDANLNIINEHN